MRRKNRTRAGRAAWGPWSLVIDTDTYAGNIERELTAYATGAAGSECSPEYVDDLSHEYERDLGLSSLADKQNPLLDLVGEGLYDPGDDGYDRVHCCIYPTPCKRPRMQPVFDSVRIFLTARPTAKQVALIKERSTAFATRGSRWGTKFKITGFRLIRERTVAQSRTL